MTLGKLLTNKKDLEKRMNELKEKIKKETRILQVHSYHKVKVKI